MITISIVSPQKSMDLIDRAIAMKDFGCLFHKYVYDRLEEIEDIYEQCKDPFSVVVLGKFRRFLLVIFLSLFLHLDFSFIYSKFSMPFWGFFY